MSSHKRKAMEAAGTRQRQGDGAKGSRSPTKARAVLTHNESEVVSGKLTKRLQKCLLMAGISESSLSCCLWCVPKGPKEKVLLEQGNAVNASATGMPRSCLLWGLVSWVFPHEPAAPEHPALRHGLRVRCWVTGHPTWLQGDCQGHSHRTKR